MDLFVSAASRLHGHRYSRSPVGGNHGITRHPRRVKDRREEALVRQLEQQVISELRNQQQQCRERFLNRWHHIRHLYAIISETMTARSEAARAKSNLPTVVKASQQTATTCKGPTAHLTPAPLHKLTSMAWLIDVAREFRQGIATHLVTMPQMEIVFSKALHFSLTSSPAAQIGSCLRNVFQAFQHQFESATIDYREFLSALFVLDRWREGEKKTVARWFHEFAFPLAENSSAIGDMKMAIRGHDLQRILFTACGEEIDEAKMQPFVTELLSAMAQRGQSYLSEKSFWDYSESHPKLLGLIKTLCWKRLTDDTRLDFYRDVYLHAKERFIKEEARVRIERALNIWRTREPRRRFARWKRYVAFRKLVRRGNVQFRINSMAKLVRRFGQSRQRRQEMRTMISVADKHRNYSLLRLTFRPWVLFWRSMQLIHAAGWRRSERHDAHRCQKRCWHSWATFHEEAKLRSSYCNEVATAFIACRHRKLLRSSKDSWMFHQRRKKEVAAADIRGRQLQQDLWLTEQIEAENAQMEIEDKLSAAVAAKARASAEKGRRRSFIEATDRVHVNRKLQKQRDERIQFKANRERAANLEAAQAWTATREQVAAEVRTTTLTWFDTRDSKAQIQTEANRIFETDAKWIRNELEQDPENSSKILPNGCRWQVLLEAPHGIVKRELTKAFYLNTVTYEKYWCDEVVLEDCEGIAREVIIQTRIDEAIARLNEKQNDWELQRQQNMAAARIQL